MFGGCSHARGVTFFFFGTILCMGISLRHWGCCLLDWEGSFWGAHPHHFCASFVMRAFHSDLFCVM